MGAIRWTLNASFSLCLMVGACSTESDVQKDLNADPSTAGNGGTSAGQSGSSAGGSGGSAGTGNGSSGGSAGDGSASAGDEDAGAPVMCEKGPTKGSSVLLIGDSYVDINNKAFGTELQRLAKGAGALAQNDKYADRSISGTQLVGGFLGAPIPQQYANEMNADGHVKTVIMDGGGNDVLLGNRSCITDKAPPESQSCVNTINTAMEAAKKLLAQMDADGVENVIYFFYPYLPGGGLGGDKKLTNQTIDYAIPLVKQACEEAPVNCVFVDTRGLFGEAASDFQDGIHPTVENIKKISAAVWKSMQRNCIAQ